MSCEVTAIIPAYNAEKYIEQAILSVLDQTVECKMIIINDASKDKTADIIERYREKYPRMITFIDKKMNEGVCAARNQGVELADTEYVAFLDADDWWSSEKTEVQLRKIKEAGVALCYAGRELMNADGTTTGKIVNVPDTVDYEQLLGGNVVPCSSTLIKREVALQYPMSHDELHEDYIMWLSMLRDGHKFVGIDEPFLKSRLGEGGKSRNKWKSAMMTYKVYRYMGIPAYKAIGYFISYAVNGVKKYRGSR